VTPEHQARVICEEWATGAWPPGVTMEQKVAEALRAERAERARLRPLLERALDAVSRHDFPKGHKYDVLCGDLKAEMGRETARPGDGSA